MNPRAEDTRRTAAPVARAGGLTSASWVLGLTAAAQFVLQLDFSIINVALPTVQRELDFSAAGLQWVVTGYALTFGALLLVAGRVGDLIGHRRALLIGFAVFAVSSLSGGLAVSSAMLIVSRLVQGASAAFVAPAALALLTDAYTSTSGRARALGIFQGASAAGATAGIVLGGVLTEYLGWRAVLLVNPPVIAILMVMMVRKLPSTISRATSSALDLPGAGLITAAVAALIYGLSEGQTSGFNKIPTITTLVLTVALTIGFVINERRARQPMLPLGLLQAKDRRAALSVMFLLGAVVAGYVYFVSLYLQKVLGFSAVLTGIALIPATATVMTVSIIITRRLLPKLGAKLTLAVALALIGAGQLWLSQISPHGNYLTGVLGGIVLTAVGMGLAFPTISFIVTSNVSAEDRGIAGGLLVAAQQVGSAVGLAVLATLSAARTTSTGSLTDGYRLSYLTATGVVVAAAIIMLVLLRGHPRPSATNTVAPDPARGKESTSVNTASRTSGP